MGVVEQVFKENASDKMLHISPGLFVKLVIIAGLSGIVAWLSAIAIDSFVLTPIFCESATVDISICANSASYSGFIAGLLVGIMTIPIFAVSGLRRALLVVGMAVICLWGVPVWTGGWWLVSVLFAGLTYSLVYATIIWLNRFRSNTLAIVSILLFVVLTRIVLSV